MKRLLLSLMLVCSMSFVMNAQSDYKSAIGLRFGGYYDLVAVSYKTFITTPGALEFNLGFRPFGVLGYSWTILSLSAAYQHHFPIAAVDGLKWYVGAGATAYNSFSNIDYYHGFGLLIFPTGGVDYKFANIPLNVSVDVRPSIKIAGGIGYYNNFYFSGGISGRYTLN